MVPFAGFEMPVQYSGIIEEHMAVREAAGLFDVSHMGEVYVRGPKAFDFVQHLVTNDASKLYDGRAMYTAMCTEKGGIVDDLLVYRFHETEYLLVINAANIDGDFAWMQAHNPMKADLYNASDEWALLAIQGPKAIDIVQSVTDIALAELKYYHFLHPEPGTFLGAERILISRTGYTGEKGLELYCAPADAPIVWKALMEAGANDGLMPTGLGARDTLRLEAGFCLYGNDITTETNPLEAGLGWITKLDKPDFVGAEALRTIKAEGTSRKLVAFIMDERGIPRQGYPILAQDETPVGEVTSGTQSPILEQGIGMGYVPNDPAYTTPGSPLLIQVRRRTLRATVQKPPLHKLNA